MGRGESNVSVIAVVPHGGDLQVFRAFAQRVTGLVDQAVRTLILFAVGISGFVLVLDVRVSANIDERWYRDWLGFEGFVRLSHDVRDSIVEAGEDIGHG